MSQAKAANRGPLDGFLWQKDQSLFFPRAWKTVANYSYEMVEYPPQSVGALGGTTTFLIPNNVATYLGKIVFACEISRATAAGANDRFDNFLGYSIIEQVKVTYGQNDVDVLDGEFMKFKFYDERMDEYKRDAMRPLVWGDLEEASLVTLYDATADIDSPAASTVNRDNLKIFVELPVWHTRSLQQYMPQVLGSEIFYKIKLRPVTEFVRGAVAAGAVAGSAATSVAGVAISNQRLYVEQIYAGPDEQARLHMHAQRGFLQLHDRQQIQTVIDPAGALTANFGTRTVQVKLDNFNTATSYLLIAIRDAEQLSTASNIDRWRLRGQGDLNVKGDYAAAGLTSLATNRTGNDARYILQDITVKSSNGEIKRKLPREMWKPISWGQTRSGPGHADGLIAIDFGKHPLSAADAYGSLNLGLITAPILEFTFVQGADPTSAILDPTRPVNGQTGAFPTIRIDVFGTIKNLNFYKGGNLYTQFQ